MTEQEKINYLKIALSLQGIGVNNEMSERIIKTYESILIKGGDFSISDAVEIEMTLDKKFAEEKLKKNNPE